MKHFLNIGNTCCVEGRLLKSRYGGNDPDVWDAGQCEECEGAGCDLLHRQEAEKAVGDKIAVSYVNPPIPDRRFDYCATRDNDEPNDDLQMLMGYGRTEREAIDDLVALVEDAAA